MSEFLEASERFDKYAGGLHMATFGSKQRMQDELGKVRYSGAKLMDGTSFPELINLGYFMRLFVGVIKNQGLIVGADPEWGAGWCQEQGNKVICIDPDLKHVNLVKSRFNADARQYDILILRKHLPSSYGQFDVCLMHNRIPQMCDSDELEKCFTNIRPSMKTGGKLIVTAKFEPREGWDAYIARTGQKIEFLGKSLEGQQHIKIVDAEFKKAIDALPERKRRKLPEDIRAGKRFLHFWDTPYRVASIAVSAGYKLAEFEGKDFLGTFQSGRWPMGFVILEAR